MNMKRFTFLTVGVLSFFALAFFLVAGTNSTAKSLNIEEKFTKVYTQKVSEDEMMGEYSFDKAHSSIGFRIKHMGLVDVPGNFRDFTGMIKLAGKKMKDSSVEFKAQMKSVDTGVGGRDNHLRTKDFFEVEKYPEMIFKSKEIKKKGKKYMVKGDLTIKDVTKEVIIPMQMFGPVKDDRGNVKIGVTGQTVINRRQFNITYGGNLPNGTPTLADNVTVDLQIEAAMKK